jgi:uncharacterized membrane protein
MSDNTPYNVPSNNYCIILVILILSLFGIPAILSITKNGAGISPDSVRYICAARNLLEGKGLWTG